jgi:hypothetical protein
MAKRFFYVCVGLFLLVLTYHIGARGAGAQAGSTVVGFATGGPSAQHQYMVTSSGDVWYRNTLGSASVYTPGPPQLIGNFWAGTGPTKVQSESWGEIKRRYR